MCLGTSTINQSSTKTTSLGELSSTQPTDFRVIQTPTPVRVNNHSCSKIRSLFDASMTYWANFKSLSKCFSCSAPLEECFEQMSPKRVVSRKQLISNNQHASPMLPTTLGAAKSCCHFGRFAMIEWNVSALVQKGLWSDSPGRLTHKAAAKSSTTCSAAVSLLKLLIDSNTLSILRNSSSGSKKWAA
eukprot:Blabericola_migrator_1__13124@NODE_896_length_6153_cov_101_816300_g615_i1_p4_GENE_NODE_896_length_6153_cov_101_816300_g615_i1NODE_896_length_6153_cov_101_816300_g615_i1_p4_ORF_typecomplete_len187_score22_38zfRanBP/PF00641_18/0_19zfRanBP/PF00641_18/6_1e03_NODE_896_length_6153_cov_101_816300_g615_i19891549